MRSAVYLAMAFSLTAWASPKVIHVDQTNDPDRLIHLVEEVPTPASLANQLEDASWGSEATTGTQYDILDPIPRPDDFNLPLPLPIPGPIGGNQNLVILEQIINLGERVWKFIADNKPVINVTRNYANALPKGVRTSEDLDGWSSLQYRSYRMHGKNGFNATVYDVTYTLVHRYGGNYDGRGSYLENATVLPHKVEALWGYTVDVGVDNVGAVNVGTKNAPVGSLVMELYFKVQTVVKASQFRSVYEFRGDRGEVTTIREEKAPGAVIE